MVAEAPLAAGYRAVVADLDGVVYLDDQVIPGAAAALGKVREHGVELAFVTNNSYRSRMKVAAKLRGLGVGAAPEEVLTSSEAVVHLLGGPAALAGMRVLAVGGPGLREALTAAGAELLGGERWRAAQVVVVGIDTDLTYRQLADATLALRAGARFVGSNADTTFPTPAGLVPGNGSVLALLETASGVAPEVAGKPEPALLEAAAQALGHGGPFLMVGDRADTDLVAAHRLGWDSALVLTGVTGLAALVDAPVTPRHLLHDLGGLLEPAGPALRPATPADDQAIRTLPGDWDDGPGGEAGGLVAEDTGGSVVGAAGWRRHGDEATLNAVALAEPWRGRLNGTRLVVAACHTLRAAGCHRVSARPGGEHANFLTRLGFRPAPRAGEPMTRPL